MKRWTIAFYLLFVSLMISGGALTRAQAQTAALAEEAQAQAGVGIYDIRQYGAVGDGKTLNTKAVQAAIDACASNQGGTVLVPAGIFVIGAVELRSSVTLHLAAAARLLGSRDAAQYHAVEAIPTHGDTTLNDGNWALIYAVGTTNVTLEGPGAIDGGGPPPDGLQGPRRPYGLLFYRCKNLAVRNIKMVNSPYHMIRAIQSAYLKMDGIHIHNRVAGNDDGFHFVSCEHVNISNCTVQSQDDACALFGSCKYVSVTNSYFSTRWSVFRFGGGSVEDITVSNCLLRQVYGCPIKFQGDAGSRFENISFSNLVLDQVTGPISISISSPPGMAASDEETSVTEPAQPAQPARRTGPVIARHISFSDIHGTVTTDPPPLEGYNSKTGYRPGEKMSAIVLNCVGSAVMEDISFSDIGLTFGGGGTAAIAANRQVPEKAGEYFQLGPIPAYGMYARGVRGLTLDNVRFTVAKPDLRPAVIFDRVEDATVARLSVQGNEQAESALRFINARDVLVSAPRLLTPAAVFLQVEGAGNSRVIVEGGDVTKAGKSLTCSSGAAETMAKVRE